MLEFNSLIYQKVDSSRSLCALKVEHKKGYKDWLMLVFLQSIIVLRYYVSVYNLDYCSSTFYIILYISGMCVRFAFLSLSVMVINSYLNNIVRDYIRLNILLY